MGGISVNIPERPTTRRPDRPERQGTTTERGYGSAHQKLRESWRLRIQRGEEPLCFRCHKIIYPDAPGARTGWHLDHDDDDRTKPAQPSHWWCNLSAAGRLRVDPRKLPSAPAPQTHSDDWDDDEDVPVEPTPPTVVRVADLVRPAATDADLVAWSRLIDGYPQTAWHGLLTRRGCTPAEADAIISRKIAS